ncbi:MAG: hypothetical protein SPI85_01110, partial [Ellagibacter isourolithinifaciens]|nr:hypothetical protein [Ellagibacter isourolithinifaciens]
MGAASTAKDNKGPQGRRAAWRMGEKGASVILLVLPVQPQRPARFAQPVRSRIVPAYCSIFKQITRSLP